MKRTAEDKPQAPSKKGGFTGMDCPFSKLDFLSKAKATSMELELQPKKFGPGGYGYQKSGGIAKVEADGPDSHELGDKIAYVRPSCIASVLGSKDCAGVPSTEDFLKKATPLKVTFEISPVEFSTGAFGWMAHRRQAVTVDGKELTLQVNFNAPINKSKDRSAKEVDPVLASIDSDAMNKYILALGVAQTKDRDDLTKIRGIGPWIEQRLNRIKIFTFKQIASMTPEIEDAVNAAISYFPGRVHRDEWALQARKIVGGKWDDLNPILGKGTGQIKIDGEEYERSLIDIAEHAMADGVIEHFEAEALWFSASDGNKITPLERKTLSYIMSTSKFKVDDDAMEYLNSKLASLDARGVIRSRPS